MPISLIRQLVERPVSLGRTQGTLLPQIGVQIVQTDIDVAIEVDKLDLLEDLVVFEDRDIQRSRGFVGDPVIDLACRQHRGIDFIRTAAAVAKHLLGQTGFKHLSAGKAGDDDRDPELFRTPHAQGIDRLETAVADV